MKPHILTGYFSDFSRKGNAIEESVHLEIYNKMKTINEIIVPRGIRYVSEWKDFTIPEFPHIMDKQIPGCGFTEWCLTNNQDVVLCSPRRILLENKTEQHEGEVYYFRNEQEDESGSSLDKDLTIASTNRTVKGRAYDDSFEIWTKRVDIKRQEFYNERENEISNYISARRSQGLPFKILVTYDSFCIIKNILYRKGLLESTQIFIDEMQAIFTDSRFKAGTELGFVTHLSDLRRVCFLSATPMMEDYLDLLPYFKDLPYYRLDWKSADPRRVNRPNIKVRTCRSVHDAADKIIPPYLAGNFAESFSKGLAGEVIKAESREAVIYVNSVNNILQIISKFNLKPEQVNIICSDTSENRQKVVRKLGKAWSIGKIPLKGEPHKMFTFCTRTVYLGADFYSTNARTFVISDANIETLAVDISLDLPQIMGRQRLTENPWKNCAEFYYKSSIKPQLNKESFNNLIKDKLERTQNILKSIKNSDDDPKVKKSLIESMYQLTRLSNYSGNYLAVDRVPTGRQLLSADGTVYYDELDLVPKMNELVMIAERRAFDIQSKDYADRFSVFAAIESLDVEGIDEEGIKDFLQEYEALPSFYYKLKYLSERKAEGRLTELMLDQVTEPNFRNYLNVFSPEQLKAKAYNITTLKRELKLLTTDKESLMEEIYSTFTVGSAYPSSDIKQLLSEIYERTGYNRVPTATDIEDFFEVESTTLVMTHLNGQRKRARGYKILKKK
jgi:hypothetical protein